MDISKGLYDTTKHITDQIQISTTRFGLNLRSRPQFVVCTKMWFVNLSGKVKEVDLRSQPQTTSEVEFEVTASDSLGGRIEVTASYGFKFGP